MPTGSLKEYRARREFAKTPEPRGKAKKQLSKEPIFVVQKHSASHLHYDLRLEIGGVLVSWAVPKGPPLRSGDKRLAVMTEDHPIEYAHFEGIIPPGEYGAGTVLIWDKGTYQNIKMKDGKLVPIKTCLKDGTIEVLFSGTRLKGPYALIQTKMRGDETNWLLLKMKKKIEL